MKQGLINEDGVSVGGRRVKCIRFADDMALLAESETKINEMLENLSQSCENYGMKINIKKTKAMVIGTKGTRVEVKIGCVKV